MEKKVDRVALALHMTDGRRVEIPLEPWQLELVSNILGLQVDLDHPERYRMSPREVYQQRADLYWGAVRELGRRDQD